MKQIFVRGISRSGGTLMVTVLDAHPQVAMCYELYENLLAPPEGDGAERAVELRDALKQALKPSLLSRKPPASKIADNTLRTFVGRVLRCGVEPAELLDLVEAHLAEGLDFRSFAMRMRFIERIARAKMDRQGKRHWGAKMTSSYEDFQALYPDMHVLYMLRDGRDVAASRKLVGNFNQTVEKVAQSWKRQLELFERFAAQPGTNAHLVHYEALTERPGEELRKVLAGLDLPWNDRLLAHHDEDLTLYQNPTGHLSADQVNKPINRSSVGRWKNDLTAEEVATFESIAGEALAKHGYELAGRVTA